MPHSWLPLNYYMGKNYLYYPSDFGNSGKKIITDTTIINWDMEIIPYNITNIDQKNDKYYIDFVEPFEKKEGKLIIHSIDKKNGLYIWQIIVKNEETTWNLYVNADSAPKFDVIVNFCKEQKQLEFEFENKTAIYKLMIK